MDNRVKHFGRFFALLKKMPYVVGDDERHSMVVLASGGRTNSLKELTRAEYDAMCDHLEGKVYLRTSGLRRRRSSVLHQMQKMGVDTTDWARVDALCMDVRIAGKRFVQLSEDELRVVEVRLRSIERKGGFSVRGKRGNPQLGTTAEDPSPNVSGTTAAGRVSCSLYIMSNFPDKGPKN